METRNIDFRLSSGIFDKWIKADLELKGTLLRLFPPCTGSSRTYFRRKLEAFRVEDKLVCTRKGDLRMKLDFAREERTLYLRFRNNLDAEAWLSLLQRAADAGLHQQSKSSGWVKLASGAFRPARKTDKETWTLHWVLVLLRDFAGQIVYYDTHKWHLTRRSLLVLAVDLRKAHGELTKQRLCWWLRMIRQRTMNADGDIECRVVLVGTHSDKLCPSTAVTPEGQEQLRQAQDALLNAVRDAFGRDPSEVVVGGEVMTVSSYNLDGIDRLGEKLQEILTDPNGVTLVGNVQPSTYFALENIARNLAKNKPLVTLDELREACKSSWQSVTGLSSHSIAAQLSQEAEARAAQEGARRHLVDDDNAFEAALQYLHDTGAGMWFRDVVRNYVFIRPQWLTRLFAMIEMQKHKGKGTLESAFPEGYRMLIRQGLLHLDLLKQLWKHDKRQHDPSRTLSERDVTSLRNVSLNALVSLMCHFEVMREVPWAKSPAAPADSVASAMTPSLLRGPPQPALSHAAANSVSNLVRSPKGHDIVFIPCMLNSVWGKDFDKWWEPWYITPLPGQRVMAVRLVVRQRHYSSISLMPEILKGVLPNLDLASKPILGSDGLVMHGGEQVDGDRMDTMIFLRSCENGYFTIDIAVKRDFISSRVPAVAFENINVDQLYRIVSAQGLSQVAETLRSESATGMKLSGLDANDIRKLYQVPNDEVASLMTAIQHWEAQGVPLHDIGEEAPVAPLHSMSAQLWIFIRAVVNALPQEVIPCCQWLVLSPAMLAEQGLPMDDKRDIGWTFEEVMEARQRRLSLLCARTNQMVNYQEYFEAADIGHCVVDVTAHESPHPPPVSTSASAAASTSASRTAAAAAAAAATVSVSAKSNSAAVLTSPSAAASAASAGASASAPASTLASLSPAASISIVESNTAAVPASPLVLASTAVPSPAADSTAVDWTWPSAAASRDNGGDTAGHKQWCWRAVTVGTNTVSKRTSFRNQSSRQLERVLSHWLSHSTPMSTLRVEHGDQKLAQVWRDLDQGGTEVKAICFDGRHGGLLQITAPIAGGWVELSRARKGAKTEYPRMWNYNDRVNLC